MLSCTAPDVSVSMSERRRPTLSVRGSSGLDDEASSAAGERVLGTLTATITFTHHQVISSLCQRDFSVDTNNICTHV